jgi:DNA-binding NtrC family response regulator
LAARPDEPRVDQKEIDEDRSRVASSGKKQDLRRLLLVEDEPLIRMNMADTLEALGYKVSEASTLSQARDLIESKEFETVISDMGLPDGAATEFLLDVRAQHPEMRIIISTGATPPEELQRNDFGVLSKPFSDDDLKDALEIAD